MEPEPDLLAVIEDLFMQTDSIVLSATKVGKLSHSGDSTGAQLLKALGAKQTSYDQESMQPRVLVSPDAIPARTLKMLESSVAQLKKGKASAPIDLARFIEG